MEKALETYLDKIAADYKQWMIRTSTTVNKEYWSDPTPRIKEFADALELKFGKKYIKILSGGSAHSFIVSTEKDAKFKKGDILMAASWSAPARNFPRGNIFDDYKIRWTGA
ncbi:uncharacterized protein METZ01_LOCUS223339 [marine metagenome]|uniref:Uncharacterized protein n=1 Tax=marine metagenome TaxID=408172 RepID=A0A382G6S7_9ZZZZ